MALIKETKKKLFLFKFVLSLMKLTYRNIIWFLLFSVYKPKCTENRGWLSSTQRLPLCSNGNKGVFQITQYSTPRPTTSNFYVSFPKNSLEKLPRFSNGNKAVFHIPQCSTAKASTSDCYVSFPKQTLEGLLLSSISNIGVFTFLSVPQLEISVSYTKLSLERLPPGSNGNKGVFTSPNTSQLEPQH